MIKFPAWQAPIIWVALKAEDIKTKIQLWFIKEKVKKANKEWK